MKRLFSVIFLSILASFPGMAEQAVKTGKYEVHYNAFLSTFLSPEIARAYQIGRSKNKAVLNISVLDVRGEKPRAVEAEINIRISNAYGQEKKASVRKVEEHGESPDSRGIYYLVSFKVSNRELVKFHFQVKPKGESSPIEVRFEKEFFTESL